MVRGRFRFESFLLDGEDRRLSRAGERIELNPRYFDALALLVSESGKLVSKEQFHDEVWRGVPVTDEALTQCIRTLRRQLGDEASRPRFIETVPKHGYRFVAPVETLDGEAAAGEPEEEAAPADPLPERWRPLLLLGAAGTLGGGAAGLLGGLFYGFMGTAPGVGAASMLLVLVCLTVALALVGGAGVAFGIAATAEPSGRLNGWSMVGGAAGGVLVGAFVKLLGLDAISLLFGQSPGDMTGAAEGALLGGAVGLGAWLGGRGEQPPSLRRSAAAAALTGAAAGVAIALLGGRLLGGSLDLLARRFPQSQLRLDPLGALVGDTGFGPVSHAVTAGLEGLLFGGCVVGAMALARRRRIHRDGGTFRR